MAKMPKGNHPVHKGFAKIAAAIAKRQETPVAHARAELAEGARKAGTDAKKANPRLKRVK